MKIAEKRELGLRGVPNAYIAECEQIIDTLGLRSLPKPEVISILSYAPMKRYNVICRMLKIN